MGAYEQQNACRQQLDETQGSLRFAKYELGRKGQEEAAPALQLDDIQVSNAAADTAAYSACTTPLLCSLGIAAWC